MKRIKIKCPYCGRNAVLQKSSYVYGERARDEEYVYVCSAFPKCDAYVGVHKGTFKPKGTLANGDLRHKRICAHRIFEKIWLNGIMTKKEAYRWLQYRMGLTSEEAHIGYFSDYRCDEVIAICQDILKNNQLAC